MVTIMKNSVNLSITGLIVEELPSPASLIALKDIYNGTVLLFQNYCQTSE
jgi:hypothetical protein